MTAGSSSPTAVPLVVTTAHGRPVERAMPRAVKAASRSSIRTCTDSAPLACAAAAAYASGAERDPGDTTRCSIPRIARARRTAVAETWLGLITLQSVPTGTDTHSGPGAAPLSTTWTGAAKVTQGWLRWPTPPRPRGGYPAHPGC